MEGESKKKKFLNFLPAGLVAGLVTCMPLGEGADLHGLANVEYNSRVVARAERGNGAFAQAHTPLSLLVGA